MHNRIDRLPDDLFRFNPNLRLLDVRNNILVHVGYRIFDNLRLLASVRFNFNICTNTNGADATEVARLKNELITQCPATRDMIPSNDRMAELERKIQFFKDKLSAMDYFVTNNLRYKIYFRIIFFSWN